MHKVAVVIVNYNTDAVLRRCLTSLSAQTRRADRVILVDNNSHDFQPEEAERLYPGIEIIRSSSNLGFAAANNLGVMRADDCDWVALLNPDAFPHPDWLLNLLKGAKSNPDYAFFASRLNLAEKADFLDGTGDAYHISGLAWRRDHSVSCKDRERETEEVFGACAAAAMYERDAFLSIGGFDEHFFCFYEDVDLSFRLRLIGEACLYLPDAQVEHLGSFITGERSDFSVFYGYRNMVYTFIKDIPWPLNWLLLPLHIIMNLVSLMYLVIRGQAGVGLRAKWAALKDLPRILKARKKVQATRKVNCAKLLRFMDWGIISPLMKYGNGGSPKKINTAMPPVLWLRWLWQGLARYFRPRLRLLRRILAALMVITSSLLFIDMVIALPLLYSDYIQENYLVGSCTGAQGGTVVGDSAFFVRTKKPFIASFNSKTLRLKNLYNYDNMNDSSPLVITAKSGKKIIVAHEYKNKRSVAFNVADGSLAWVSRKNQPGSAFFGYSYFAKKDGSKILYKASYNGLQALDSETGKDVWWLHDELAFLKPPRTETVAGVTPCVDQEEGFVYYQYARQLFKLDAKTGRVVNSVRIKNGYISSYNTVLARGKDGENI